MAANMLGRQTEQEVVTGGVLNGAIPAILPDALPMAVVMAPAPAMAPVDGRVEDRHNLSDHDASGWSGWDNDA